MNTYIILPQNSNHIEVESCSVLKHWVSMDRVDSHEDRTDDNELVDIWTELPNSRRARLIWHWGQLTRPFMGSARADVELIRMLLIILVDTVLLLYGYCTSTIHTINPGELCTTCLRCQYGYLTIAFYKRWFGSQIHLSRSYECTWIVEILKV